MAEGSVNVDFVGNLTRQPEVRFTASGAGVVSFTVACTERKFNRDSQQWEDGAATFMNCTAWRTFGENIAELPKGARVFVKGRLVQRSYETQDGEKRTVYDVQVDVCGPDVKFHPARHERPERSSARREPVNEDPWAGTPVAGGGFSDEPPF